MSITIRKGRRTRASAIVLSLLAATLIAGGFNPSVAHASTQATYYVSPGGSDSNPGTESAPFETITHARDTVRTINSAMTGDVVVYLRGGTYPQDSTLAFNGVDSGTNGYKVVYKAYPGETPTISGGVLKEGSWIEIDSVKHIYRTTVPSGLDTRQLYVNGVRAVRARSDYLPGGFAITSSGFTAPSSGPYSSMSSWANPTSVEIGFKGGHYQFNRCGVASISGSAITMKQPCWGRIQVMNAPSWIENAYEVLDSPREWYLDRATNYLYYIPSSNEDMSTASVMVPQLESLMSVAGTSTAPIQNIRFDGITFADATYLRPNGNDGYPDGQGGGPMGYFFTPNMTVSNAKGIDFWNGSITRMGSEALYVSNSQDVSIVGNRFSDNSHRALEIETTDNFSVLNNVITKQGEEYFDAVAVRVLKSSGSVEHNELYDLPYSAIERNYTGAVKIRYNYIHDYMLKLTDGGGIYTNTTTPTLDSSGNTLDEISYNYLLHQGDTVAGIYLDDGSSNEYVHDNVIKGAPYSFLAKGPGEVVKNNYFDRPNYWDRNIRCDGCTLTPNQLVADGVWPTAAVAIMNSAGLEPAYLHVKDDGRLRVPRDDMITVATNIDATGHIPDNVLDDSSLTMWATEAGQPQSITLSLGGSYKVSGLEVNPRQQLIPAGSITNYKIYTSADGTTFTQIAQGTWGDDGTKKFASFAAVNASFVRLEAISGVSGSVSVAGIDVIYAPDSNLIGNWKLNERGGSAASDVSGYDKTGTLVGDPAWGAGRSSNGLTFDGIDSYVSIPDSVNPTALTVSMWVKPAVTTAQSLWARTNSAGATSAWSSQLRINSNGKFEAYMFDGSSKSVTGTTTVQAGTWYHLVLVASNSGQMKLYVNGQPEGTPSSIATMWTGGDHYSLGSASGGGFGWFKGVADEVRLYNKVLSENEISALFLSPTKIIGNWKLDETTGTSASDSSGRGVSGTVGPVPEWVTGTSGNGLSFNGSNTSLSILDPYVSPALTVSMWVKPAAATAQSLWARTNASGPTTVWSGQLRINSAGKFEAYTFDGGGKSVTGTTTVQPDVWYHVAMTASNDGALNLYVNGQTEGAPVSIGTMWAGGDRYVIGSNSGGGFGFFKGVVDEVKLYRSALSASDVNSQFAASTRPIGQWKLDETSGSIASDSSGSAKPGTLAGGAQFATGRSGNGVSFNGSSSYVDIPDATNPTALTVSMWVKPAATTAQNLWVRTTASGPTAAWSNQLRINSSGKFEAYMFDGNTKAVIGTTTVQAGVWFHVSMTVSNDGQMKLYVNGQPEGTPVAIDTMWTGGSKYMLGANSGAAIAGGVFGWYSGVMDEVRLYQGVMSDSEILSLYGT